jgi:hypothetical protein
MVLTGPPRHLFRLYDGAGHSIWNSYARLCTFLTASGSRREPKQTASGAAMKVQREKRFDLSAFMAVVSLLLVAAIAKVGAPAHLLHLFH